MQKSMDKNSNRFSSPKTYFLKSGLGGAGNFHSKLKRDLMSPKEKKILKSFGYRRGSNQNVINANLTTNQGEEPQNGSPKFSKYFNNSKKKKAATTRNKDSKKIVFFQKSKKDETSRIKNSAIKRKKISGKTSPRADSRVLDPIKANHKPIISARRGDKGERNQKKSANTSRYGKAFFRKTEESTRRTEEKSKVHIKWEGSKWPDIQSQLLFGQCIGEGSFAKVYDAFDKVLKKAVAVKVIKKKMFKSNKKRKLVQMEVDILSGLSHKNIVKFYRMLEDHKRVRKLKICSINLLLTFKSNPTLGLCNHRALRVHDPE